MPALRSPSRRRLKVPDWTHLDDEDLLDVRMCDLKLQIPGSAMESRITRLYDELGARGLSFRPHCWVSDEWFSPDGVPGIAVPFYLMHPRLARLEGRQMLEVEGVSPESCMKILRHEAGHAIDTAYRLSRRRKWQELFGKRSQPYPDHYQPRPYSRNFVRHFDMWYAQSHPAEDFAETFAVWLKPRSRWRSQYDGWGALKKLRYVDDLMKEIGSRRPLVSSRQHLLPLKSIRRTLRQHYASRKAHYGVGDVVLYDNELRRLFSDSPEHARKTSAAAFLRTYRSELRRSLAAYTGHYHYTIDEILGEVIQRCTELNLRLSESVARTRRDALVLLTVIVMNYLHSGRHGVAL